MQKSESIAALTKALAAVQSKIKPAVKNAVNPHFKSEFADLGSIWASCREQLAANGLAVVQGNSVGLDGTVIVETILSHSSGEWIQSELCLPLAKNDPQGVGSAITYGRRYALAAIVGIVADADDDGNHASGNGHAKPAQAQAPKAMAATVGGSPKANGKPATGKATGEKDLATNAQIALIHRKALDHNLEADAFARKEFEGVDGVGDLSKAAASWLISELQG